MTSCGLTVKSQLSIQYINNKPVRSDAIVIATQHTPQVKDTDLKEGLIEEVIKNVIPADMMDENTKFYLNATGRFVIGGPQGDCGLTGRKIIADTYGGMGRHGGGAFSGKDPSKVDRSACYMARYAAKNVVAADWQLIVKCSLPMRSVLPGLFQSWSTRSVPALSRLTKSPRL